MADANFGKVVRVTNIADFDFTPEKGAMYDGQPFHLRAGESLLFPWVIGDHLATHLARQIKLNNAPIRDEHELDGRGKDTPLWSQTDENLLKAAIISDAYTDAAPAPMSETERLVAETNRLNGTTTDATGAPTTYKDKAAVIAELTRRQIQFNPRASKADLEAQL